MVDVLMVGTNASFPLDTEGNDRHNGGTLADILDETLAAARAEGEYLGFEVETKRYNLHEFMRPYRGAYDDEPEWIKPLTNDLRACHVMIAATQTNWFGPSSNWQMLVEYLTALENKKFELTGKVGGMLSTCHEAGGDAVLKQMFLPMTFMGLLFPPFAGLYRVKEGQGGEDNWQNEEQVLIGQNTVRLALILQGHKIDHNNWGFRK